MGRRGGGHRTAARPAAVLATAVTLLLGVAASCASEGAPAEADPEPATAQSSETTQSNLRSVDWANRAYEVCDQSAQLADGDWQSPDATVGISLDGVLYGDADGDGREDAVVKLSCYPIGGNAYPTPVNLVFTLGPDGPTQLGEGFRGGEPTIVEGGVQTIDPVWADGDPRSTPSGSVTTIWRFQDGAWVSTVTTPPSTTTITPTTTTTTTPAPATSALGALPAIDGYGPVGSGCTPGPGALPDGWWFGEAPVPPRAGTSFQFDLACSSGWRWPTSSTVTTTSWSPTTTRPFERSRWRPTSSAPAATSSAGASRCAPTTVTCRRGGSGSKAAPPPRSSPSCGGSRRHPGPPSGRVRHESLRSSRGRLAAGPGR